MNKNIVRIGSGAGYQGDRVPPAVKLVENAQLDYLVLECLAERTLTDSIRRMKNGGKGYDPRLREWLTALLLPAVKHNVTIITNMGAADPKGAGEEAIEIARSLGINIKIVVVSETVSNSSSTTTMTTTMTTSVEENWEVGCTYLGADALIDALKLGADLVIAGRVADPSLFVAPIAYTFNWDLNRDFDRIAQATLAGHVLECGCHLTGGYFAHPLGRNIEFSKLLNLSLPFCDIDSQGNMVLGKIEGSGGELSERTCKQQLTYEIGNPKEYITPDIIVDFSQVQFQQLSENSVIARGATGKSKPKTLLRLLARNAGYKAWAEVSYGGLGCVERAHWASKLVHSWMEERKQGLMKNVITYLVGFNSLYLPHGSTFSFPPASLPPNQEIPSNHKYDEWTVGYPPEVRLRFDGLFETREDAEALGMELQGLGLCGPAGGGGFAFGIKKDNLLKDQPPDIHVYPLPGISSLNIVLNFALDGGVCVSRRIDRHGKTLSDLILNQWIDFNQPQIRLSSL
eukprot:gene6650-8227_t